MSVFRNIQEGTYRHVAPAGTRDMNIKHEGRAARKPWDFAATAAIPHLNTPEPLKLVVELLRLQTERPYIMIVDTGSTPEVKEQLEAMRADDLEIHYVAAHAYRHSSEPVCVALDLVHALCRTKYLFHTHSDLFLRRRDFLETTLQITNANTPVVGYRMSPRDFPELNGTGKDWEWMVGHTALMLYMPSILRSGASWSFQRMHYQFHVPFQIGNGWPDTETGFNYCLREAGIKPYFLGDDENYIRQLDRNLDHCRSHAGSLLHSPEHYAKCSKWMDDAMIDAKARIEEWRRLAAADLL